MINIRDLIVNQGFAKAILGSGGSGGGSARVEEKIITENGTYTAPNGVDGFNPVTVNIPDPTKILLREESEITGFGYSSTYGYMAEEVPAPFTLEVGKTYYVTWDGVTYEVTGQDASIMPGAVYIGDGSIWNLTPAEVPFIIGYVNEGIAYSAITDPATSHTVGIWKKVEPEILLQDKTITENGEYTADAGFDGLAKVLVNIAASGASPVVASGKKYNSTQTKFTITHGLGVIPDVIIVCVEYVGNSIGSGTAAFIGVSKAFKDKFGTVEYFQYAVGLESNTIKLYTDSRADFTSTDTYSLFIHLADENTFTVPASHLKNCHYRWIAIAGLT